MPDTQMIRKLNSDADTKQKDIRSYREEQHGTQWVREPKVKLFILEQQQEQQVQQNNTHL